ncbi:hypothetical protein [Corynebacterium sp.]|uniref:hypothetical protein n=1 Tax=Corynebacterium sp. TaxID=1720 RepID=UPI0026DBEB60|nr:hypothetical protein [Corynebacterium sp.]MDO5032012.1 hypothetical protein [Corynebacterium sp.]
MRRYRLAALVSAVGLAASTVAGCAKFEPRADANPQLTTPVTVVFARESTENLVLAELYKQTLESEGRAADITPLSSKDYESASSHELAFEPGSKLFIGCTGALLNFFDGHTARELSADYAKDQEDPSGEDFLERTHIALMGAIPPQLSVVEPAGAEGCENAKPELPENYVVVYGKGMFNREEKLAVSSLTKFLTKPELDELVENAEDSSVREAVGIWMAQHAGGAALKTGGDSNSSGSDMVSGDTKQDKQDRLDSRQG